MVDFPDSLPAPQLNDYQLVTDYGLSGVTFENGQRRQRRGYRQERLVFSFSLVLTQAQLWTWQSWANSYGYDWHYMSLESQYTGLTGKSVNEHYIRYISDITIEPVDWQYWRVNLQAEMDPNTLPLGIVNYTGNWVLAGTPAAPSTDAIIGGSPASPSTDFIIAGSPGFPAA